MNDDPGTPSPFFGPTHQGRGLTYHSHELRLNGNSVIIDLKSESADQQGANDQGDQEEGR